MVRGVELWESDDSEDSCFWNYHHLHYTGNSFFTKIGYKDNLVHFWVYLVGTEEETKQYGYKVSLGSSCSDNDELQYKGKQVCSLFTSVDSLLDGTSGSCVLSVNRSTVKNLLRVNSNGRYILEYKFEIIIKVNLYQIFKCIINYYQIFYLHQHSVAMYKKLYYFRSQLKTENRLWKGLKSR